MVSKTIAISEIFWEMLSRMPVLKSVKIICFPEFLFNYFVFINPYLRLTFKLLKLLTFNFEMWLNFLKTFLIRIFKRNQTNLFLELQNDSLEHNNIYI